VTPAERLEAALRTPKHPGRPALLPYLTAGWPDRDGFAGLLGRVATVADAIEIGVPFSDPMADGVTIQASSRAALEQGVTLRWIVGMLRDLGPKPVPLLLMSYLNPLLAYGLEALVRDAADVGVCGLIVPDLPSEEGESLRALAEAHGVAVVQLVTPVTPPERLALLAGASRGFVYTVTMTGVTGGDALPADLGAYLARVRQAARAPVCAGFGIRRAEQVRSLAGHADGVIVGSAVIDVLARGGDAVAFLRGLLEGG
jgi:tryptophan synthase alpha chain